MVWLTKLGPSFLSRSHPVPSLSLSPFIHAGLTSCSRLSQGFAQPTSSVWSILPARLVQETHPFSLDFPMTLSPSHSFRLFITLSSSQQQWWPWWSFSCVFMCITRWQGLPRWRSGKESTCQYRRWRRLWARSLGREEPLEKERKPTPAFWPGKSHGQRSLVGCRPWGHNV